MREVDMKMYAYTLVGVMKKTAKKKGEDSFKMEDFKLTQMNLYNISIASISLKTTQDILNYIGKVRAVFIIVNKRCPTYSDMRTLLQPHQIYR